MSAYRPIASGIPPVPDAAGTPGERLKVTQTGSRCLQYNFELGWAALPQETVMVRRLAVLCLLAALWPALALAQSAALMDAYNRYKALYEQGRYAEAEPFAQKALELGQREFGPDHRTTGSLLNNLALLYKAQGKYAEAEPLYQRSLAIREQALGPAHPSVATSLENYAALLRATQRGEQAAKLETRAKAIRAKHAEKNP